MCLISLTTRRTMGYWLITFRQNLSSSSTLLIGESCLPPISASRRTVRGSSLLVFTTHSGRSLTGLMRELHAHSMVCSHFALLSVIFPLSLTDTLLALSNTKVVQRAGYIAGIEVQCQRTRS